MWRTFGTNASHHVIFGWHQNIALAGLIGRADDAFLLHPLDVGGVAVLISAGRRVAAVWKPAALGAVLGIAVRMAVLYLLIGVSGDE